MLSNKSLTIGILTMLFAFPIFARAESVITAKEVSGGHYGLHVMGQSAKDLYDALRVLPITTEKEGAYKLGKNVMCVDRALSAASRDNDNRYFCTLAFDSLGKAEASDN